MFVNSATGMAAMVQQSSPGRLLEIGVIRENTAVAVQVEIGRKSLAAWVEPTNETDVTATQRMIDSLRQVLDDAHNRLERLERHLDRL